MKQNIVLEKSYLFAIRIVKLAQYLVKEKSEFILSKQILKSGTSIGANVKEAMGGHSEKDFFSKLAIAYKEALETEYWLNLLIDTGYLDKNSSQSLLNDCEELLKIIGAIKTTIKKKSSYVKNN